MQGRILEPPGARRPVSGAAAGRVSGAVLTALLVLAGPGVARADLFDFEDQVPGNPPNICRVAFIDGSYKIYDRLDLDPSVPPNDLAVRRVTSVEFADPDPLVLHLDAGVTSVTLNAGHQSPSGAPISATLEAFDAFGSPLTSDTAMVDGTVTTPMTVTSPTFIIREVHLTLGTGDPLEGPARTGEAIDDLDVGSPLPPCNPDTEPPTVTILYPTQNLFVQGDGVALVARVTDNEELGQITWTVQPPTGPPNVFPADASVQPPSGRTDWTSGIPPTSSQAPIPGYAGVLEVGDNTITATVCDTALPVNNCTTSAPRSVVANILPDTLNLYLRAVELTQAAQDEITVSPFRRGSMFLEAYQGLPLIKSKTTFARVYPGLEGSLSPVDVGVMLRASSIGGGGTPTPIGETASFPVTVDPNQDFNPNDPNDGVIIPIPPGWDDFTEIEITA